MSQSIKHRYVYGDGLSRCHVVTFEFYRAGGKYPTVTTLCGRKIEVYDLIVTDMQILTPRGQTLCRRCAKAIEVEK